MDIKQDDIKVIIYGSGMYTGEGKDQVTALELPLFNAEGKVLLPPAVAGEGCGYPVYVNPKQILRILKRREAKRRLIAAGHKLNQRPRYIHESRHRHAISRSRGFRGRFEVQKEAEQTETQIKILAENDVNDGEESANAKNTATASSAHEMKEHPWRN